MVSSVSLPIKTFPAKRQSYSISISLQIFSSSLVNIVFKAVLLYIPIIPQT